MAEVDALTSLLDSPRARGAFLLRAMFEPPWSVRVEDRAPLSLVADVRGGAWVVPEGGGPVPIGPGDVVVLRGPDPYTFAGDPATPPQVGYGSSFALSAAFKRVRGMAPKEHRRTVHNGPD